MTRLRIAEKENQWADQALEQLKELWMVRVGLLRVVPGKGFYTHPQRDMEIIIQRWLHDLVRPFELISAKRIKGLEIGHTLPHVLFQYIKHL